MGLRREARRSLCARRQSFSNRRVKAVGRAIRSRDASVIYELDGGLGDRKLCVKDAEVETMSSVVRWTQRCVMFG